MKKYLLILLISFLAFTLTGNPPSGWYQQTLPDLGSRQINDILFLDSLIGFAIASKNVNPDTSSILKTTNGGDNWQIILTQSSRRFSRIQFVNSLTGFISGGSGSGTPYLYKTTNGGDNWFTIPGATLGTAYWDDMSLLNEDTIWLVDDNGLNGGVYRTTNGGLNWTQQFYELNANPEKIYFYNKDLGFFSRSSQTFRTTNGGLNWNPVLNEGFTDMEFLNGTTGWKANGNMKKTTDGGLNWVAQQLPILPNAFGNGIKEFILIDENIIWGVGESLFFGGGVSRGIIYHTTNSGSNWGYQLPDTSFHIVRYDYIDFIDQNYGWAYHLSQGGVHTKIGGDTTIYTNIQQIGSEIPNTFILYQNYPNPFNPATTIRFEIKKSGNVRLNIYDAAGKEIKILVNSRLSSGYYEYTFNAEDLTSGVYFYRLEADNFSETKKMILMR